MCNDVQATFYGLTDRLFISPSVKVSDCYNIANSVMLSPILPAGII